MLEYELSESDLMLYKTHCGVRHDAEVLHVLECELS